MCWGWRKLPTSNVKQQLYTQQWYCPITPAMNCYHLLKFALNMRWLPRSISHDIPTPKVVAICPARTCRDVLKNVRTKDFCPSYPVRNSCLVLLTPPLAALRNLLLFSISEEFTTFQHIRPGVGWVGVGWDVNVHLHLHTTWVLCCCYVGHGLGWGGMLTFICTGTPRGCYVAATWGMGWGGVGC